MDTGNTVTIVAEPGFGSGSAPTDAHQVMTALLTSALLDVARLRRDELPGLVESLQDDVLITAGGTTRRADGWFEAGAWRYGHRQVHELFLNADRRQRRPSVDEAEDVLVTLLHEACHVWARANGIRDTSRNGRYHNRRFAEIALQIGLDIEKDARIGHVTPCLSAWARDEYADLLSSLGQGLALAREPERGRGRGDDDEVGDQLGRRGSRADLTPATSKYVFASCRCQVSRSRYVTIRVAVGAWRAEVIACNVCGSAFTANDAG